jgi:hypothetical protein
MSPESAQLLEGCGLAIRRIQKRGSADFDLIQVNWADWIESSWLLEWMDERDNELDGCIE